VRVLLLPLNIASQTSVTVRALRAQGIDARGLVVNNSVVQEAEGLEIFTLISRRKHPLRGSQLLLAWRRAALRAIRWADVVHWQSGSVGFRHHGDLQLSAKLGKARIVEFWGTDIRVPSIAAADNPYTAAVYRAHPELAAGRAALSKRTQELFARHGISVLVPDVDMESYVQRLLFPRVFRSRARLDTAAFTPQYPDPRSRCPVVMHMPTNRLLKGTDSILRAVEALRAKHRFEFQLVHGVARSEALRILSDSDILIDEMVSGAYGLAALEAMALGKPVVSYIKPTMMASYPPDLPIVNANQEDLSQVLEGLLEDGNMRHEVGRRGRSYVEAHHDSQLAAKELVSIYSRLLQQEL
jgi:hypothetical protein